MVLVWTILLFVILLNSSGAVGNINFSKLRPDHKIAVVLSERNPIVALNQNRTPKGIDILIIENFARKLNLKVDYFLVNTSLNHSLFSSFPDQTPLRWLSKIGVFVIGKSNSKLILLILQKYRRCDRCIGRE